MSKLQHSANYGQFEFVNGNRPVNLSTPEARDLCDSMCDYGFLPSFPIMVRKNGSGKNVIIDGQHRFAVAKELGLPVYFVVDNSDVDISKINKAQRKWTPLDHCHKWAAEGLTDYQELQQFHSQWDIPFTLCVAILSGTIRFANVSDAFYNGRFVIKARKLAHDFASSHRRLKAANKYFGNNKYLTALWGCFFVDYFDSERLIETAEKEPHLIKRVGDQETALEVIDDIYNFRKRVRQPLKFDTEEAMRLRNPATRSKKGRK